MNCYGASVIICSLSTVQYNLYMYYTHCSFPDTCTSNMLTSVYRRRNRGGGGCNPFFIVKIYDKVTPPFNLLPTPLLLVCDLRSDVEKKDDQKNKQ